MFLNADTIETEDGQSFSILIGSRYDPAPSIGVGITIHVCTQNGRTSKIGGWIVHYYRDFIESHKFDDAQYLFDAKNEVRLFLTGHREKWIEAQPGTFFLERK